MMNQEFYVPLAYATQFVQQMYKMDLRCIANRQHDNVFMAITIAVGDDMSQYVQGVADGLCVASGIATIG